MPVARLMRRRLSGDFRAMPFAIPTNSLTAPGTLLKAVATVKQSGMSGMPTRLSGQHIGLGAITTGIAPLDSIIAWVTANPLLAGGGAIAAFYLFGKKGRR